MKRLQHPPRYLPGLDGLRAISVIAIIIYHLNAQWLAGGFLGVDTFFVISGYLITSLLLFEYENYQTI
ncbi:acyltransferase, partial [Staphylococcus pseudintermedius]|nr:acyltransferase [Staphylococcus pseudintermedius]